MIHILKNKIEYIENRIKDFKKNILPIYRKEAFIEKTISEEEFQNRLNILNELENKKHLYEKRLMKEERLFSIEKSIGFLKDFITLSEQICILSYNSEKESIIVMFVKYQENKMIGDIVSEETYEDAESLQKILDTPFVRFVCFDKKHLFDLLNKKKLKYNKDLFSCVQRMSLFYYNDLSSIYKLDKIYNDIALLKEKTDNSSRKIKNIFEGIINT